MMSMNIIGSDLITKYGPLYDSFSHDESEYQRLVALVSTEIAAIGTVSKATFEDIYHWKAHRAKNYVKWNSFDTLYKSRFQLAFSATDHLKLFILVLNGNKLSALPPSAKKLPGIDVPVASTLLHFAYPNGFPIMDIRTAEVLYCFSLINSEKRGWQQYANFRKKILGLSVKLCYSLHDIDRALFAFHRLYLESKLGLDSKMTPTQRRIILTRARGIANIQLPP